MPNPSSKQRAKPQRPTLAFTCSCGAQESIPITIRGLEQSCSECGRIFRIPSVGESLDLSSPEPSLDQSEDFEKLAKIAGPDAMAQKLAQKKRAIKTRLIFVLFALAFIAAAAFWLWP